MKLRPFTLIQAFLAAVCSIDHVSMELDWELRPETLHEMGKFAGTWAMQDATRRGYDLARKYFDVRDEEMLYRVKATDMKASAPEQSNLPKTRCLEFARNSWYGGTTMITYAPEDVVVTVYVDAGFDIASGLAWVEEMSGTASAAMEMSATTIIKVEEPGL